MTFGQRIAKLRNEKGLTQEELALKVGYKSRSTIARIEMDNRNVSQSTIVTLAKALDTTPSVLMGWEDKDKSAEFPNIEPIGNIKKYPLLGAVACGEPIFREEDEMIECRDDIEADFCLICVGDSMINARIYDGDIVFIKSMPMVDNGQIAAVAIGSEATLKRVYYYPEKNKLVLNPENPNYEPLVYVNDELDDIRILGKAVKFLSNVR